MRQRGPSSSTPTRSGWRPSRKPYSLRDRRSLRRLSHRSNRARSPGNFRQASIRGSARRWVQQT